MSRLRRMSQGVAAAASPRVPNFYVAIAKNASGGGCCGEPPSAKFLCRDCEERLGGGVLRRGPACQIFMSRMRRTPRGVAAAASPRVPNFYVAIAKNASGGGCCGEPLRANESIFGKIFFNI